MQAGGGGTNAAWAPGCRHCGAFVPPEASFCAACGARVPRPATGSGWRIAKFLLAFAITVVFFIIGAAGAVLAACAGMNIGAPPTAEAQAFQFKVLLGLAGLFVLWVSVMIALLK